jgi:hypothetical protein
MQTIKILTCAQCLKSFNRNSKQLAAYKCHKNVKFVFCSKQCFSLHKSTKMEVNCKQCNKKFFKLQSQLKKWPNNFCSHSCSATYNNIHKTHGNRRSKLEVFLEEQIRIKYPKLVLLCNNKSIIDSELDFYFPTLHLAIELNGIFHYEPIFGESKLAQIQNNDNKKYFLCQQHQINLAIVDSSSCKYLNQAAKNKYWNIVKQIIEISSIS